MNLSSAISLPLQRAFLVGTPRRGVRANSFVHRRWAFALLGFGLILCVAYLLLVNDSATVGLSTKSIEREIRQLREENRQLEITVANLQSFAVIERVGKSLELTEHATPEFLVQPSDSVAVR